MKRLLAIALIAGLMCSMTACADKTKEEAEPGSSAGESSAAETSAEKEDENEAAVAGVHDDQGGDASDTDVTEPDDSSEPAAAGSRETDESSQADSEDSEEQVTSLDGVWCDEDYLDGGGYIIFVSEKNGMYMAMNADFFMDDFDVYGGTNVDVEKLSGDGENDVYLAVRMDDGAKCLTFVDNDGFNMILIEDFVSPVRITKDKIIPIDDEEEDGYISYEMAGENVARFIEEDNILTLKRNNSYDYLIDYIIRYFD